MIERYTLPEMGAIWTDQAKFDAWLKVEILACEAQQQMGIMPADALKDIQNKAQFDIKRVLEIEETTHHDVIAFLTNVAEYVGPASRFIHLGMTSSDLLDTSMAYLMRKAGLLLQDKLARLREVVARRAREHKMTPCIGRSHGIHAEVTSFGIKLAVWYDEIGRCQHRLADAIETISVGQISGAVGTFAHLDPFVEEYVCKKLDLKPAPASTQIIQRDRYAAFLIAIALVGSSLEKFATELRNLQRTEILEVEEFFRAGQKGSSAMPHKRNPITCERVAGMARILRGNALAGMENVALWHERDITHSSVERVIIPDSTIALDYMLHKFINVVDKLLVYPENMMKNIEKTNGLVFSQQLLLALAKSGITRENAYAMVQRNAMKAWEQNSDFQNNVRGDAEIVKALGAEAIANFFDLDQNLRHAGTIFKRVGLE